MQPNIIEINIFQTYRHTDQIIDGIDQKTTHGKVFHQLGTMFAFLSGCLEEMLSESGTIDGVGGEVCGHGQILGRGIDLLLNLLTHGLNARIGHVGPTRKVVTRLDVACRARDVQR